MYAWLVAEWDNTREDFVATDAATLRKERDGWKPRLKADGATVWVEPPALFHIVGTVMDFEESALETGFTFTNPNEKGRCGCGESFNV